jgi:hypothetical protein
MSTLHTKSKSSGLRLRVVLWKVTNVSKDLAASIFTSPWRWRQQGPPKRWYPTTSLHGVITQKTATWISIQTPLTSPWTWEQHGPPKHWYPTILLHGVIIQKAGYDSSLCTSCSNVLFMTITMMITISAGWNTFEFTLFDSRLGDSHFCWTSESSSEVKIPVVWETYLSVHF